jgi:drug/metabolite transporter (DMT)-like permease
MISSRSQSAFVGGVIICILGAICFSTKAIFVKLAYRDTTIDAVSLLALRMLFSLPLFLISAAFASARSSNVRFSAKEWLAVAVVGCLGYYVSSLLDFLGLQYVSAGIERLILFIYPTLVLLMSFVFFKEKIKRIQWLAVAITYSGLLMAFLGEVSLPHAGSGNFYLGSALIFACAITYAMYIVGSGRLIPKIGSTKFNSYAMSFACLAVLIHFFLTSDVALINLDPKVYLYGGAMAILSTVVPSYLVAEGIKRIGSDNAAIVGSIGPVSTILQAYIILHEPVFGLQIVGTAFILVGVLLIGRSKTFNS